MQPSEPMPPVDQAAVHTSPYVVMCRGSSGSRFLAEILMRNGIWMGDRLNDSSDSFVLLERLVVPFMNSVDFPLERMADGTAGLRHAQILEESFTDFLRAYPGGPWGWKLPESVFIVPLVKHRFPHAKFIHLIRDGRDVILNDNGLFGLPFRRDGLVGIPFLHFLRSRNLEELHRRLWPYLNRRRSDDYLLKTIFNGSNSRSLNGIPVNRKNVKRIRYQLGMLSWMNHIDTARRYGREIPDDYHEVRYEDLCTKPVETIERLLAGMGMEMTEEARDYASTRAYRGRIGKWQTAELPPDLRAGYQEALEIGRPLLTELGYT
jgi:hypothetical protein